MGHFLSKLLSTAFKLYKGITGDATNDYIRNITSLANYAMPSNFTFEIWFRPSSTITSNKALFSSNYTLTSNNLLFISNATINGFQDFFISFYSSTGSLILNNLYFGFNLYASDTARHNLMLTVRVKDNGNGTWEVATFSQGRRFASVNVSNRPTLFPGFNFLMDRAAGTFYSAYQLLNARFYTDAKTDAEILAAYNHGQGNNALSNRLFELPFDTINGTTTPDISGNGHDFELVNFTSPVTSDFVPNSGRKNIVFDGDSLTAGLGASGSGDYARQTVLSLNSSYSLQNIGVSGQTTEQMEADFYTQPFLLYDTSMSKNIYYIWAGGNNMIPTGGNKTPAQVYASIKSLAAKAKLRGFTVIINTITPRTTAGFNTNQAALNALLLADFTNNLATRVYGPAVGVTYADRLTDVASHPNLTDASNTTYYGDGVHMTNTGYALVGDDAAIAIGTL